MPAPPSSSKFTVEPSRFLNVDLELEGPPVAIETLATELDRRLLLLHRDTSGVKRRAHYELGSQPTSPDVALRGLCRVIEALSPDARQAWQRLRVRDFNVGVQAGHELPAAEYTMSPKILARVAGLGGRMALTIYPAERRKRR